MEYAFKPHSTNHVFVLLNVFFIKEKIGKECDPFRNEFMHVTSFVVMWPYLLPPSKARDHFSKEILSIQDTTWGIGFLVRKVLLSKWVAW